MKHSTLFTPVLLGAAIAMLTACSDPTDADPNAQTMTFEAEKSGTVAGIDDPTPFRTDTQPPPDPALTDNRDLAAPFAVANLAPTEGNETEGEVQFLRSSDGHSIHIVADIAKIPSGPHGFHIHEVGDCSAPDASSAGEHYNPAGMPHGARTASARHVGDLGNVVADTEGNATVDISDTMLGEVGMQEILGRALVLHADEDDYSTQPSGAAGDRIACGVITAVETSGS